MFTQKEIVYSKLCPHRGLGEENSLSAIKSGINSSPFMVEFDIQWNINDLYLGHPPEITNTRLIDALNLFITSHIIPKVDIKINLKSFDEALGRLIKILSEWSPQKVLVNIDGSISTDDFMKAETILLKKTPSSVLLNIDLDRYRGKSIEAISNHIISLSRLPFSISPNLETNTDEIINFANRQVIKNIHFWSNPKKGYTTQELFNRLKLCEENGLDAYLDIKISNILS